MRRRWRDPGQPYPAHSSKVVAARRLRAAPTETEERLWQRLRRRALGGWRFRRQHVIGGLIVDFYCPKLRLAVEVDGDVHLHREDCDQARDRILQRLGVAVVRCRNEQVRDDAEGVLHALEQACLARAASLSSSSPSSPDEVGETTRS